MIRKFIARPSTAIVLFSCLIAVGCSLSDDGGPTMEDIPVDGVVDTDEPVEPEPETTPAPAPEPAPEPAPPVASAFRQIQDTIFTPICSGGTYRCIH